MLNVKWENLYTGKEIFGHPILWNEIYEMLKGGKIDIANFSSLFGRG